MQIPVADFDIQALSFSRAYSSRALEREGNVDFPPG
jgi:hypothetical protein